MTVWTSVLWKIYTQMAKKLPRMAVQRTFIKEHSFVYRLYLQWHLFHKNNFYDVFLLSTDIGWPIWSGYKRPDISITLFSWVFPIRKASVSRCLDSLSHLFFRLTASKWLNKTPWILYTNWSRIKKEADVKNSWLW